MRACDRRGFTATHIGIPVHVIYADNQLPIGQGQVIPAPSFHASCLELLEAHARPGAAALDIGSGSGYVTACLSLLVGPAGRVVALERQERLAEQARYALARCLSAQMGDLRHSAAGGAAGAEGARPQARDGQLQPTKQPMMRLHNVELYHGNALDDVDLATIGSGGLFDAIHVGAAAREVPEALVALLRPGGRMVLPVGRPVGMQTLTVVDKAADGSGFTASPLRDVKVAPLLPPNAERPL